MARKKYSELEMQAMNEASINLKRIMRLRGINQTTLAEKTEIATSTISDYVNGKTLISMGNLEKIAQALHVYKSQIIPSLGQSTNIYKEIPLIKTIRDGDGLLAEDNIEEYIHFPFRGKNQPDFAIRVIEDSMNGMGIERGDIVYLYDAQWADYNGQVVLAMSEGFSEGFLRKMRWEEGTPAIKLVPENNDFETQVVLPNQIKVFGLYAGHFKMGLGE